MQAPAVEKKQIQRRHRFMRELLKANRLVSHSNPQDLKLGLPVLPYQISLFFKGEKKERGKEKVTMKALVTVAKGKVEVQEVSKPKLRDGHVLVKVKAVGLNPADWKNIDNQTTPGMRVGLDYSGVVEELGNGVTQFKPGDRIAGWVCGG